MLYCVEMINRATASHTAIQAQYEVAFDKIPVPASVEVVLRNIELEVGSVCVCSNALAASSQARQNV